MDTQSDVNVGSCNVAEPRLRIRQITVTDIDDIQLIQEKLESLYEADLHAVVTHFGMYNGHTRITFIDPKTRQEYGISPTKNVTHIRLKKDDDQKKFQLDT